MGLSFGLVVWFAVGLMGLSIILLVGSLVVWVSVYLLPLWRCEVHESRNRILQAPRSVLGPGAGPGLAETQQVWAALELQLVPALQDCRRLHVWSQPAFP